MRLVKRNWRWLVGLLIGCFLCATYLVAQTSNLRHSSGTPASGGVEMKASPPNSSETADCVRLIDAVNSGNGQAAVEILRTYGVAEASIQGMASRLGKSPARTELKEQFLKASVGALSLADRTLSSNVQAGFTASFASLGYEEPVWMPRRPDTWATASYDADLLQSPTAPVLVLNERLNDPSLIRFFQLYDRFADLTHSVVLNGPQFNNAKLDPTNYSAADRQLNALYQLIKARKPDAFVWLEVVKEDDHSDEQWLKAITFKPDGLQISNLRQFHSPFAETRARYTEIVGADMPMMISGFEGYSAALHQKGQLLDAASKKHGGPDTFASVASQLGGIGSTVGSDLTQLETQLKSLGYRGISAHWLLLGALAKSNASVPVDKSDLIDPRTGWLDFYFDEKDFDKMSSLAVDMISNSAPGDMNWTAGNLYQAIALLSQSPPKVSEAVPVLDRVLAFNFQNKPGRDHYILGAVKWRIYAATLAGDKEKPRQLAQWAHNQNFRPDLKADFLKHYKRYLESAQGSQN